MLPHNFELLTISTIYAKLKNGGKFSMLTVILPRLLTNERLEFTFNLNSGSGGA